MKIMTIPISEIKIGNRRREELGDIQSLAKSIESIGLLHPIVVDDDDRLVAGGRRIEAHKLLGWREIEARSLGDLADDELREIELEENLQRKDLTSYERSRTIADLAKTAKKIAGDEFRTDSVRKPGRPKTGLGAAAERIGVAKMTIRDAEKHVEAVDRYPFMRHPTWTQDRVLKAAKVMSDLPETDQANISRLVTASGAFATDANKAIENYAAAPQRIRDKVVEMSESSDERERDSALGYLIDNAPAADSRAVDIRISLNKLKSLPTRYSDDPFNERISEWLIAGKTLADEITAEHRTRVEKLLC